MTSAKLLCCMALVSLATPAADLPAASLPPVQPANSRLGISDTADLSGAPAPDAIVLTLADALARAGANNPRLRESQAATEEAAAGEQTARAYNNPILEIYAGRQYARPITTPGVPGLLQHYAAYQPIEIPVERRTRRRVAQLATESTRAGGRAVTLTVVALVKRAFYGAIRQQEEIRQAQENLTLVEDLYRRVEVQVNVGEKGRLELTRAEAELASARFVVQRARLEYADALAALRVAIAASPGTALEPAGQLEPRIVLPALAEARDSVLRAHPALAQSRIDIEAARSNVAHQKALRIPQPTLFAEFENQPDLRFWRAGLAIPLPIFDRRRGQIAGAEATAKRATAQLEQRRLEVISALERAFEQYQIADRQLTSLEAGALHAAENAVEAAKAAYRYGERGIVEVLDAQRVLQSTRGELLDARYARQAALVDLEELGAVRPNGRP